MFNWLTIELTNKCNKSCSFCGRDKARKEDKLFTGLMDIKLFRKIISQYNGDIVQFSKDGEPLLYRHLYEVAELCKDKITNIVTNGILIWEKADIVSKFTSVCVSVTEEDDKQYENVRKFIERYPTNVVIKFLGDSYDYRYEGLGLQVTRRSIHSPGGDWDYKDSKPVVPELGICIDFLNKPSISWDGKFSICNRYDPEGLGIIGDCKTQSLDEIWNSEIREEWLSNHKSGNRSMIDMCRKCSYWGCPTNG